MSTGTQTGVHGCNHHKTQAWVLAGTGFIRCMHWRPWAGGSPDKYIGVHRYSIHKIHYLGVSVMCDI